MPRSRGNKDRTQGGNEASEGGQPRRGRKPDSNGNVRPRGSGQPPRRDREPQESTDAQEARDSEEASTSSGEGVGLNLKTLKSTTARELAEIARGLNVEGVSNMRSRS